MLTRIVLVKPKHDLSKDEFDDCRRRFDEEFKSLDMVYDYRSGLDEHYLNQGYTFTALIELKDRDAIPVYETAIVERIKPLLGEMADHYIVTHV
ncbi:hypothetical protein P389DRAFT_169912 [Cystobasidium minutum MCA 4210]|uniref:uncharacterized protein n=1 Tax=Cystobasidium minutum MCA 4210 TaxID=1397322 RepID=UPI0034CF4346|eukprot:jgi/Rhomi1/169912/fgenesh1_kg.3_\